MTGAARPASRGAAGKRAARALVLECLWLEGADVAALRRAAERADWGRAEAWAARASVLPALGWTLARTGVIDTAPRATRYLLREAVERTTAGNAFLRRDAGRIARAFAAAGVPALFDKGTALLLAHVPNLGVRHTDDIDVWVDATDAARATRALGELGYAPVERVSYRGQREALRTERGVTLVSERAGPPVDLHWAKTARLAEGLRAADTVDVDGARVAVAGARPLYAALCAHVLRQHAAPPEMIARHAMDANLLLGVLHADEDEGLDQRATRALVAALRSGSPLRRGAACRLLLPGNGTRKAWGTTLNLRQHLATLRELHRRGELLASIAPARSYLDATTGPDASPLALRQARRYLRLIGTLVAR